MKADEDAKAAEEAAKTAEKFDCGLPKGEEGYEDALVDHLNEQGQKSLDANKALQEENDYLKSKIDRQADQSYFDWLDTRIEKLGGDFHEKLGEGETEDLQPDSEQYENRLKLANRMSVAIRTYKKQGKAVPSRNKVFDGAVKYLFKKETNKSKTDEKTAKDLQARSKQVVGKSSRKSSALSAKQKAQQVLSDFDDKVKSRD